MKTTTSTLFTFVTISISTIAQTDITTTYQDLDTLSFYNIDLRAETKNNTKYYWVNDKAVNQKTYEKYKSVWDNIGICLPCYLKTYDENDKLINEGVRYTDCAVGIWIEYYPSGNIKVIGHYKENDTGNWKNLWKRGYCSRKEGLWTYYDEEGEVIRTENYLDDELKIK